MKSKGYVGTAEQVLYHSLLYELQDFKIADTKARWNLNKDETIAVQKWIENRLADIKERL